MRAASSAITACRSALSMRGQRAISGSVRPQPRQRLVLGSIMQMAMHGVSWLIPRYCGIIGRPIKGVRLQTCTGAHDRLVAWAMLLVDHDGGGVRLQRRRFF